MKNHFIIPYTGNKREEVEEIYKHIDFENIETIIEPFCGSSAMSFYIASKNPNKYTYILNDLNHELINLYEIIKDEIKFNHFNLMIDLFIYFWNKTNDKKSYYKEVTGGAGVLSYFIKNKYYNFRIGIPPIDKNNEAIKILKINYLDSPIINFLRSEKVILKNVNAISLIEEGLEKSIYLLDPPYIMTSNSFYNSGDTIGNFNIYEYLMKYNGSGFLYLIVENTWIMNALLTNGKIIHKYEKKYNGLRKKIAEHIIIKF